MCTTVYTIVVGEVCCSTTAENYSLLQYYHSTFMCTTVYTIVVGEVYCSIAVKNINHCNITKVH